MSIEIKVPELGESVVDATVGEWHKQEGDAVSIGDILVELETDKVDLEVGAESAGVLLNIHKQTGEDVKIGEALGEIDPNGQAEPASDPAKDQPVQSEEMLEEKETDAQPVISKKGPLRATPVAMRLAEEKMLDLDDVSGSGPNGRITREDVEVYLDQQVEEKLEGEASSGKEEKTVSTRQPVSAKPVGAEVDAGRKEERIRMSRRRRTIAQRLVEAQQTAAMLTTFNDVNMSAVMTLRKRRGEAFKQRHDVKLGFMSFFVKSVIGALKSYPRLNAEVDGDEMIIKHYYDIGIAVGAEDGLVVPVVRDADRKSFAEIERNIITLAQKAQDGSLALEDLLGGTFTITNGGIFGSLLSTPILNTPQVGILGMHRIEERPVVENGEVVIRPMMYLALSYDHRIVDGREAVQFLIRVKEMIEDPETLLLEG